MRKPFFWAARGGWYIKEGKSQVRLGDTEEQAYEKWRERQQVECADSATATVAAIAEKFLQHANRTIEPSTYASYSLYVVSFCNLHGAKQVRELKPHHVTAWLDSVPSWGNASRRQAIITIKRCFNWAVSEGLIEKNPIASVTKPRGRRREKVITEAEHNQLVAACKKGEFESRACAAFRAVLIAMKHSGGRPGIVARVRVENVLPTGDAWVLQQHKTVKKTGKPLVIWLSPCLQTLTRILAAGRSSGPLFLNARGEAWCPNAIRCRMRRLREKLGMEAGVVAYAYRHTFTTNALLNGTDIATVAELLGHTDVGMISQHYGHLDQAKEHLRNAAARAVKRRA